MFYPVASKPILFPGEVQNITESHLRRGGGLKKRQDILGLDNK